MKATPLNLVAVAASGFVLFSVSSCQNPPASEEYVARIGESVLTQEDLTSQLPEVIPGDSAGVIGQTIEAWARRELLFQQAVREGLLSDSRLQAQLDEYRKALYGNTFLDMYLAQHVVVTTDEVRDYYTRNRDQFKRKRAEVALLHFLLETEREALEVRQKLLRLEGSVRQELLNFYNVHAQIVTEGTLIPPLDRAVFARSEPKGVLGPVRSDYGVHVLEVLEFYPADSFRGLDQVYEDVSQQLFQEKSAIQYDRLLDSLLVVTPLKLHPDFSFARP
ncbi:MAG: peptidyl-prolyl cis-trans isomerase [Fidelibacterota bacterium]